MSKEVKPFSSCGGFMTNVTLGGNSPTLAINEDVYGINDLFVSSYIVSAGKGADGHSEYIAMDTGNNPETLAETLENLQIRPEQIKVVFLTHAHGDHTGGLSVYPAAKVYISETERESISHTKNDEVDLTPEEITGFQTVRPGDTVKINEAVIEVIATPGHTPGTVSYIVNNRYLFAGATLNIDHDQKAEHQACTLNNDHELLKESNLKLARLVVDKGIEMIFTTHGGYTTQARWAISEWVGK